MGSYHRTRRRSATPGVWGAPNPLIVSAFDDIDFRGKKVLDIGCWDGLWSFEAEKRGASEIYATDDNSQRVLQQYPTFDLAHALRKSKAKYFPDVSVYDVGKLGVKDPLLAFSRLRQVMKEGAIIIISGQVIPSDEVFAKFYYKQAFAEDDSNWWVPSMPCLREWIECSFFEVLTEHETHPTIRSWTAKAVCKKDPRYYLPDRELKDFDLNAY